MKAGWQQRATTPWHGWFLSVSTPSMLFYMDTHKQTYLLFHHTRTIAKGLLLQGGKSLLCIQTSSPTIISSTFKTVKQPAWLFSHSLPSLQCAKLRWAQWRLSISWTGLTNERVKTRKLYWTFIGNPSSYCSLLDLMPSGWMQRWLTRLWSVQTTVFKKVGDLCVCVFVLVIILFFYSLEIPENIWK